MTPICNEIVDAIASSRPLSAIQKRHARSCDHCERARSVPELVSAACQALSSVEPHIGFAVSAPALARARVRRRRSTRTAASLVAVASLAALIVAMWPKAKQKHQTAELVPDVVERVERPWRPAQPAQQFDPVWVLDHDDVLSLSKKQREALRDVLTRLRKQIVSISAARQIEEIDLGRELRRQAPDRKKITRHISKIGKLGADLREAQTMAWLDARDLLTAEQQSIAGSLAGVERTDSSAGSRADTGAETEIDTEQTQIDTRRIAQLERALAEERQQRLALERALKSQETTPRTTAMYESLEDPPAQQAEAVLAITSKPYSTVYVDGRKRGVTPVIIKVAPGRHRVALVRSDLGIRKTMTVSVKAGERRKIATELRRHLE